MFVLHRRAAFTHVLAVVAVGALLASSCTSSSGVSVSGSDSSPANSGPAGSIPSVSTPDADPDASGGPGPGALDWSPCEDAGNDAVALDCATLEVPLDHSDPGGATIEIAVARFQATGNPDDRIGSLVFNPGGPGVSGIEYLEFGPLTMSDDILQRFDLVSFDPRGVGASSALECDSEFDDEITLLASGDDAGWEALLVDSADSLATCTPDTMALAEYVGTNNAARDMDMLRAALGDEGLSYVGYSYGTRLGATYAELFPGNVRALVLDAGVKPVAISAELSAEQSGGFDRALENFAAACEADSDCIINDLGPTLEVIASLRTEIAEVGSFDTDDPTRVLTPGELDLGIVAALYSKNSWPFLASAIFTASAEQDGSLLQALGDSYVGRQTDGTYDNSQTANGFITCADDPARPNADEQRAIGDEAADQSTYFADALRGSTGCLGIAEALDPLVIGPAAGAAPIVVIGNTGDPATPFEWSEALAASLESAVLYTVEAEGHTAYGTIDCVQNDIDDYLINLDVPDEGSNCSDNADADFFVPEGESQIAQIVTFFDCVRDEGVDIPEITEADVLVEPSLETVLGEIDLSDPAFNAALIACQDSIPDL